MYWYPHKERLEPQKLGALSISLSLPWKPLVQHTVSDDSAVHGTPFSPATSVKHRGHLCWGSHGVWSPDVIPSAEVAGTHWLPRPAFYVGVRDLNSGLLLIIGPAFVSTEPYCQLFENAFVVV